MKKLHKSVYYHVTRDGLNIGVILGEDGLVCVDLPMSTEETLAWKAQIQELTTLPIRAVIYTSADRVSFEAIDAMNTPVIICESARSQLYTPVEVAALNPFDATVTMIAPAQNKLPEITFDESTTMLLGTDKSAPAVEVTHQGGHAPGSSFVFASDAGIMFVGEHVAVGQPPLIAQGNYEKWNDVIGALRRNKKITTVVPGRGAPGNVTVTAETLEYIKGTTARVRAHIKARRARNDLVTLIPDVLKSYGLTDKTAAKLNLNLDVVRLNVRAGLERLFDDLKNEA
jgi:glyoxylase-like metal-dependent hydrolase (beta-lactamase superfamily II)